MFLILCKDIEECQIFCKAQHLKHTETRDLCFTLSHVVLLQEYKTGNKYQNNNSC